MCQPGESVELRPEPNNPADKRAVAVFSSRAIQIGYIRAEQAPWICGMINSGRSIKAVFQQSARWGAVIRVSFDGNDPYLPPDFTDADIGEPDFWPDEMPPDE